MPTLIGKVSGPAYADDDGKVFVQPEDLNIDTGEGEDEEESGLVWPFGRRARLRRIGRREARLGRREARLMSKLDYEEEEEEPVSYEQSPADVYQAAAAAGMISENQYNGLANVALLASGAGFLSDTVNRNLWGKSLVLDSDAPALVLVTGISVAGLPVNVGAKGAPLSMFSATSTRFGISFGRRLALTGQTFLVNLLNIDAGSGHVASGGIIADELNPYAMQKWMEYMLLQAAVNGFQGPGF